MKRKARLAIPLVIFAVLAFLMAQSAAAQTIGKNVRARTPRPESGNRAQEIPFQLTERGHIFLPVRINGSEPLWFVLDSGSGSTLLNKRLIEKLSLKVVAVGEATGAGEGADEVSVASGVNFDLSGVRLANQEVPAIDFKRLETFWGRTVDGLLGYDFIRRFVFEVDYEARVIKIYKTASYRYRGRGQSLPITTEDDHPHICLSFTLPKRKPLEGKFIVDGGAGGATMEFAGPYAKKHNLLRTVELTETKSLPGIGGNVSISYGRGEKIRFGRFSIENPIVGFPQANRGAFANPRIAGIIGGKLLRRFTVIYDDRRRRIIFEPNSSFARPE